MVCFAYHTHIYVETIVRVRAHHLPRISHRSTGTCMNESREWTTSATEVSVSCLMQRASTQAFLQQVSEHSGTCTDVHGSQHTVDSTVHSHMEYVSMSYTVLRLLRNFLI
jgi:hypothetical protein